MALYFHRPPMYHVCSKIKIVHIITRLILGGAQENTLITCRLLADRGHNATVITGTQLLKVLPFLLANRFAFFAQISHYQFRIYSSNKKLW